MRIDFDSEGYPSGEAPEMTDELAIQCKIACERELRSCAVWFLSIGESEQLRFSTILETVTARSIHSLAESDIEKLLHLAGITFAITNVNAYKLATAHNKGKK